MPSSPPPQRSPDDRHALLGQLDRALHGAGPLVEMDEARFMRTHVLYEGRSDQQQRIIDWFGARAAPWVDAHAPRPYRVLSVGCGSGLLDLPVARHLARPAAAVDYVGVDPNSVECEAFERRFAQAGLSGVTHAVVPEPFEAFTPDQRFDLVHVVHCLYYLPDAATALAKARSLLAPGGRLVLVHAPCEALNDLASRFYDKAYGRPTVFAEDCAALLDAWGCAYVRERIGARVDVTPLAAGDPDVGRALRDFIVQVDSGRLPAHVQDLVDRYIAAITEHARGRAFIDHPADVFVIDEGRSSRPPAPAA